MADFSIRYSGKAAIDSMAPDQQGKHERNEGGEGGEHSKEPTEGREPYYRGGYLVK